MNLILENAQPTLEEFIRLRNQVGWGETPVQLADTALSQSLFHVVARYDKKLVGMARVVGDGATPFFAEVSKPYQRFLSGGPFREHSFALVSISSIHQE